ncbi:hypothetical protein MIZ01_1939 [Sideroxyarcus emersonii]|uniref:Uncharacterized protein n=1 Tax=Sideroxyarcus emersonii TaxID=2764705 RepID=A0AAN1XB73_9PROT|nr:hypothetical protein [Sideroxyarcus emersonii]BCK88138.1 hypothetical protein MIZ01_1939 [Sideroxyarcus emersonii]
MQIKYASLAPGKPRGPLRKLAALILTVAMVGLALMFSAVLLVVIALVGAMAWAYLWWKTRELRKQMRDLHSRATRAAATASNDAVFEGEVIRVVEPHEVK